MLVGKNFLCKEGKCKCLPVTELQVIRRERLEMTECVCVCGGEEGEGGYKRRKGARRGQS